ncbi:glycosyltransferase family 4 protein [Flexivirga sp. ID2601S]|uniref:D-inositol 3-phosphate glycosyltransferase n=1 Tax=Flexivirga aerilata TaxID=1656889 RepID=A0A849ANY1_9MICO|nr:glycosyltransferase family 4 protein [Flexivirga aerilata]NNG40040.1 glycosyltransferase family 4 protein [Flexivirga aerilata]
MRIALVSDCYPPRLGGMETQVHGLATHLRAAGHGVEVFTITPGPEQPVDGVTVHRLGLQRDLPGGWLINPAAAGRLRAALRAGGFDVAHAQLGVVSPFAMDGVRVALGLGLPVAATWHSVTARAEPFVRALGYPRRWAGRGVALSAVSPVAAEPIRRAAGARVSLLPNGIDTSFWCPPAAPAPRRDGALRVVSAMRLAVRKRPLPLLEAVREARASGADLRLTIAGEGPLRGRLECSASDAWCELPGRLTPVELRELYRSADVYVAPAHLEAFGIAAAEALATGLPVVAPRSSGVAGFVEHGRTGLLVADDAGLRDALVRWARDHQLRESLSSYTRHARPGLDWSSVVGTVIAEYERAIG